MSINTYEYNFKETGILARLKIAYLILFKKNYTIISDKRLIKKDGKQI